MNPQAAELNAVLESEGPAALRLLSQKGKNIFFPRKGLVAQGLEAKGKTINASIGEAKEDDGTPLRLSPLADRVKLPPADAFSYAPSFGKPALRDRWAEMIREKNPSLGDTPISRPVTTNALTHGLAVAGYMFVDEGDEIVLPHYYWGNYRLIFSEAYGAVMKTFETFNGEGPEAGFNVAALSEALMSGGEKKILLLNFPTTPRDTPPPKLSLKRLSRLLKKPPKRVKPYWPSPMTPISALSSVRESPESLHSPVSPPFMRMWWPARWTAPQKRTTSGDSGWVSSALPERD